MVGQSCDRLDVNSGGACSRESLSSEFLIYDVVYILIVLASRIETQRSHKRGSRQGSIQLVVYLILYIYEEWVGCCGGSTCACYCAGAARSPLSESLPRRHVFDIM